MGGFQPFLRAPRQFHMVAKLMLADGPKRQTAARWDRYRPVPKRSETAQLFLAFRDVSRPAGDLVGLGRWAPTTRAGDPRTLAYLVDAPEGRSSSRSARPYAPQRPCPSRCATQESAREIAHPSSIRAQRPTALGGRFGARRPNKGLACRPWVPPRCSNFAII